MLVQSLLVTARDFDKNIENRIQETNSLMTQVRETLQDVKEVLSARRVEIVRKDCATSPPSTSGNKSPENRTISFRENDKIDEIIRKLENIGRRADEEKFGSEKLRNSTVTEIAITDRASSPIAPLTELTDLRLQTNQIKSFTDKCIQNDCDLLVTSSRRITEDKCSGTDFEELQIIEETKHQSETTKIDRIPRENPEIIDKSHRLAIQHLPKINIARALVIQNALKLNIKPIEAYTTNNDRFTNIGYKEIKIEEKPKMFDCAIQLQTERCDKATTPLIFYDDKTVQVSDLESDRSIIANLNNNKKDKETSELDRLSDDIALILKSYQISDLKYKQSSDLTISNATRSSRDSCSVNKTFLNQHGLLQQSQRSPSPDNTAISDKISDVVEKSETITNKSEAIQCDLLSETGKSIEHDSTTAQSGILPITVNNRRLGSKLFDFNALSTMFYNNSFDSNSSRETGEIGDFYNEPQCKCSNVSLGEVHNCREKCGNFDITKQKTIYNNWVSYYLNRKSLEIVDTSQNSSS